MKRIILLLAVLSLPLVCSYSQDLLRAGHPRLIMDDGQFAQLCGKIRAGDNEALTLMHQACMKFADGEGLSDKPINYVKDASNKRILGQSRLALLRIFTDAYAFRFTGDEKYLRHAESDMLQVCSFPNWNPSHFLDVGEMAAAVAFGYDWLYQYLAPDTRKKIVSTLRKYAFDAANNARQAWFYNSGNNWNQVCNSGLVCAALATFEDNPAISRRIINDALRSNRRAMYESYAPDGNYAEGASYWEYGTSFQILMMTAMESCLGSDYGLSGYEGFDTTCDFILFSLGTSGQYFNYYDNGAGKSPRGPMWYFAAKFNKPSVLVNELSLLKDGRYNTTDLGRLLPMYVYFASLVDASKINTAGMPEVFSGRGVTPVVLVRTSWEDDAAAKYLGFKGGRAESNHAHMDAGSFVYDSDGMRWALDMGAEGYSTMEVAFDKNFGGGFWTMTQNSPRWKVFRYNNHQHNTLTVNDKNHNVKGKGTLLDVYDDNSAKGGKMDLTPVFGGDLKKAERTAVIRDGRYLEITDDLTTQDGAGASVRWNMATAASVKVTPDGILLTQKGITMLLQATGADVKYATWSANPMDYDSPFKESESKNSGITLCGFTFEVPASSSVKIVTTVVRQ